MTPIWEANVGAKVWVEGEFAFGVITHYNSDDDIWVKMESDGVTVSASLEMISPADF